MVVPISQNSKQLIQYICSHKSFNDKNGFFMTIFLLFSVNHSTFQFHFIFGFDVAAFLRFQTQQYGKLHHTHSSRSERHGVLYGFVCQTWKFHSLGQLSQIYRFRKVLKLFSKTLYSSNI
jgi:hypothetical protein